MSWSRMPWGRLTSPRADGAVREAGVGPEVLKHPNQVRLAAAVEARHPHGRLGRAAAVADVGIEDALEAMLVLALADEAGQLVLKNLPLVGVVRAGQHS